MSSVDPIATSDRHAADAQFNPQTFTDEAATEIEQAIKPLLEGDFHRRWDSVKRFSQELAPWGDRAIPHLINHLHSAEPEGQWFLIRALSQFDSAAAVEAIAQLLITTPDEALQAEAIRALTSLGDRAIATLAGLLDRAQDLERRRLAARALGRIRRTATIAPLLSVAADADPQLRAIALEALGSFHDPQVTPVLLAALSDQPSICAEAIRTLGRRADLLETTDLIGPLQQCLSATDETVATESAIALGRLGGEPAAIALGEQLTQPLPTPVKVAAVRALGWMDTPTAIAYLSRAFSCAVPVVMPTVQQEIARSLGHTRSADLKPQAAQPLLAWLQAAHPNQTGPLKADDPAAAARQESDPKAFAIKQAVISSLARLSATAALDSLIPVLSDPDSRIRMHALSALKQIDPRVAQAKIHAYLASENTSPHRRQQVAESLAAW